ncbi:hypothetical protein FB45DRAFT_332603 [Roridomyces roridus]|uniref:Uncharacterized protein n=1 Tax=Roridomyces roridus TaxID=1738132 RepID=A0AAD7B560_9AGAR|nr:hypothetical protein FB45DRAFT_332603 [Roridomyces roridus]
MAQLSVRIEELETNNSKEYKSLIDPLLSSYITLMDAILEVQGTCARYLFHHRARSSGCVDEEEERMSTTLFRIFRERLKELETPIADLRGGWPVLAASLAGELEASGETSVERLLLWMFRKPERPWSSSELAAHVADADEHLDFLVETHEDLELVLAEIEGVWSGDGRPDSELLHRDIGKALMVMLRLDRALVTYRTHTLRAHGVLDQWPDERLCAAPWRSLLLATEGRELLQEYSQGRVRWLKVYEH